MIALRVQPWINGQQQGSVQPIGGSNVVFWPGGKATYTVTSSNWNGGSTSLQYLGPDGSTLIAFGAPANFSANGTTQIDLHACMVTVVVTGSPAALYASLDRIPE